MEEWVVPQLLEWFSHSLAYEITQHAKTNHTTFHGLSTHPLWWPIPCRMCFSLNPSKSTSYLCCVSHWIFCNETSRAWTSLGPKTRHCRFWLGSSPGKEELKNGRKKQWEKPARKSAKYLTCAQFSLAWSLTQRRLRTEEPPLAWATATK